MVLFRVVQSSECNECWAAIHADKIELGTTDSSLILDFKHGYSGMFHRSRRRRAARWQDLHVFPTQDDSRKLKAGCRVSSLGHRRARAWVKICRKYSQSSSTSIDLITRHSFRILNNVRNSGKRYLHSPTPWSSPWPHALWPPSARPCCGPRRRRCRSRPCPAPGPPCTASQTALLTAGTFSPVST